MFYFRPDGTLQHVDSGMYVHAEGGIAVGGIDLVLQHGDPETRLAFDHDANGCFRHRGSGLYIHPKRGRAAKGSRAFVLVGPLQLFVALFFKIVSNFQEWRLYFILTTNLVLFPANFGGNCAAIAEAAC